MNLEDAMAIASRTGMTIREYYDEAGVIPREVLAFANEVERVVKENCASVCESRIMGDNNREDQEAKRCADDIRSKA